jgi:hypothetical protein
VDVEFQRAEAMNADLAIAVRGITKRFGSLHGR